MFVCPLFRKLKTTAKLKGANIDTIPTLIITGVENLRLVYHHRMQSFCLCLH